MSQTITPKDWEKFQHYKDRSPSWVKLHRNILDDFDFHSMQDASKALAPLLWLLASEYDGGQIPFDIERIAFRVRMPNDKLAVSVKQLIDKGFFVLSQGASELLADCLPREEKSKSRERVRDREETKVADALSVVDLANDGVTEDVATEFLALRKKKKAPLTNRAWDAVKREANKAGWPLQSAVVKCLERNWQTFEAEWVLPKGKKGADPIGSHADENAKAEALLFGNSGAAAWEIVQ